MPAQDMSPTAVPTSPNSQPKCAVPLSLMKVFAWYACRSRPSVKVSSCAWA